MTVVCAAEAHDQLTQRVARAAAAATRRELQSVPITWWMPARIAGREIRRRAESAEALLVLSAETANRAGGFLVREALRAATPVLVAQECRALERALHGRRPLRIVVASAVNGDASAATRWVAELALHVRCRVEIVHVTAARSLHAHRTLLDALTRDAYAVAHADEVTTHVVDDDDPVHGLLAFARERMSDLLVVAQAPESDWLEESITARLLSAGTVNVAVIPAIANAQTLPNGEDRMSVA